MAKLKHFIKNWRMRFRNNLKGDQILYMIIGHKTEI